MDMDSDEILFHSCLNARGPCSNQYEYAESLGLTREFHDQNYERWSWDQVFISMAFTIARRSPDSNTQHGCIIVDKKNHIVATGFNGWPPGAPDDIIPNTREGGHKYRYVIHAEVNAVLQATQSDLSDCRAYITGLPCNECLKVLIAKGVKELIVGDTGHVMDDSYFDLHHFFLQAHDIEVKRYDGKVVDTDSLRQVKPHDEQTDSTNQ